MPLNIQCPHCQAAVTVKDERQVGSSAMCPRCQKLFLIDAPTEASVEPLLSSGSPQSLADEDPLGVLDPLDPLGLNVANADPLGVAGNDEWLRPVNSPPLGASAPSYPHQGQFAPAPSPTSPGMPQGDFHLTPTGRSSLQDLPYDESGSRSSRLVGIVACVGLALGIPLFCGGIFWMAGSLVSEDDDAVAGAQGEDGEVDGSTAKPAGKSERLLERLKSRLASKKSGSGESVAANLEPPDPKVVAAIEALAPLKEDVFVKFGASEQDRIEVEIKTRAQINGNSGTAASFTLAPGFGVPLQKGPFYVQDLQVDGTVNASTASTTQDGIWKKTKIELRDDEGDPAVVTKVVWSGDGKFAYVATSNGSAYKLDAKSWRPVTIFQSSNSRVRNFPNGVFIHRIADIAWSQAGLVALEDSYGKEIPIAEDWVPVRHGDSLKTGLAIFGAISLLDPVPGATQGAWRISGHQLAASAGSPYVYVAQTRGKNRLHVVDVRRGELLNSLRSSQLFVGEGQDVNPFDFEEGNWQMSPDGKQVYVFKRSLWRFRAQGRGVNDGQVTVGGTDSDDFLPFLSGDGQYVCIPDFGGGAGGILRSAADMEKLLGAAIDGGYRGPFAICPRQKVAFRVEKEQEFSRECDLLVVHAPQSSVVKLGAPIKQLWAHPTRCGVLVKAESALYWVEGDVAGKSWSFE